jgi:uncharacterized protein with beta-barrel porin domain
VSVVVAACPAAARAAYYSGDVAVIDRLFTDNGLSIVGWTQGDPATWDPVVTQPVLENGINWDNADPARIVWVNVNHSGLTGDASFVGLDSLEVLWAYDNSLTSLNLQGLTSLKPLHAHSNSSLTSLNLQGLTNLEYLAASYNSSLTSLNLQGLTSLKQLDAYSNSSLTSLNLQGLTSLQALFADNNSSLTSLNLQGVTGLERVDVSDCRLSLSQMAPLLTQGTTYRSFGVQTNVFFKKLFVMKGSSIDLSSEKEFDGTDTTYGVSGTGVSFSEVDGVITLNAGTDIKIAMTNTEFTGVDLMGLVGAGATVTTGKITLLTPGGMGAGLGGVNTRAVGSALVLAPGNDGIGWGDEAAELLEMLENINNAATPAGKIALLDSMHGESVVGGQNAVARIAAEQFADAVFAQALRPAPSGFSGLSASVSAPSAHASLARPAGASGYGGGVSALGGYARLRSHDGYFGNRVHSGGGFANLDKWLSDCALVGGAFGVTHANLKWDRYGAKTGGNAFSGALYASLRRGAFTFAGQAFLGYGDVDTRRRIPAVGLTASGDGHMWWGGAALSAGSRHDVGGGFVLAPSVRLDYWHARLSSISERGAGALNLNADSHSFDSLEGRAALALSRDFVVGCARVSPSLSAGVAAQFGDRQSSASTRMAAAPNMPSFRSESAKMDRLRFLAGAGVDVAVNDRFTLEFAYQGGFQSHYNEHRLNLGVAVVF